MKHLSTDLFHKEKPTNQILGRLYKHVQCYFDCLFQPQMFPFLKVPLNTIFYIKA